MKKNTDILPFGDEDELDFDLEDLGLGKPATNDVFDEPIDATGMTIIDGVNTILNESKDSALTPPFWDRCKNVFAFLQKELELTPIQIVVVAILSEAGETLSWREMAHYVGCTRLSMMTYSEEIEALVGKRWIFHDASREHGAGPMFEGFRLERGVIKALRHNKKFVPEKIDGLSLQQFVAKIERRLERPMRCHSGAFICEQPWLLMMVKANQHLPLCQKIMSFDDDIQTQSLLLASVVDYSQNADTSDEGLILNLIEDLFANDEDVDFLQYNLFTGRHPLIENDILERKCEEGIANIIRFSLTSRFKNECLEGFVPSRSCVRMRRTTSGNVKGHASIKEKQMFYNADEQEQIERLTKLLSQENLPGIQQRLEEEGMRKGFACLFHGAPGTGKTETVLQLARRTGRDIMQVDIAGMRDKFVGESEKNIKAVFSRYRELCKQSEVMPILFFNEADALINKRTENISHSVDKMDNAMQNIILQEIEDLDGILIATTNLTANLDPAFDRRFLFKVNFHKPDDSVRTKLWCSMMKGLSQEDAERLAEKYDFSGGQIENIARKRAIDYILYGKKASFDQLDGYCKNELLDSKADRRRVGF